jgi:hypothetical protein
MDASYIILFLLFLLIILYNQENFSQENKYVCFYAYYEKNEEYKENFKYFLNNGGLLDNVDYYFILNGKCTVSIPDRKNIKIIKRENKGFDFGAWSHTITNYLDRDYDYYIFINTSVRGPYNKNWLNIFLDLFNKDDVRLVGSTICIMDHPWWENIYGYPPPYSHVQSMFFILDDIGFKFLKNKDFFNDEEILNKETKIDNIVFNKEVKLSQLLLKNNWNINCYVDKYRDLDYRIIKNNINPSSWDVNHKNAYFGRTLEPEEVIFYKYYRFQ